MQYEIITDIEKAEIIRPEWERLLSQNTVNTIFLTPDYMFTWWRHLSGNNKLFIIVMSEGDKIIGIAPLMLVTHKSLGISCNIIKFIGSEPYDQEGKDFLCRGVISRYGNIDFVDFIILKGYEEIFIQALFDFFKRDFTSWDLVDLHGLKKSSSILYLSSSNAERHRWLFYTRVPTMIYIRDVVANDMKSYEKELSKKTIRRIRESTNRFKKTHTPLYYLYYDWKDIGNVMNDIITVERNSKRGSQGNILFKDKKICQFYKELLKLLADKKMVVLGILNDNDADKIIAYELSFIYNNTIFNHTGAYNKEYSYFSPGKLITWYIFEHFINLNYKVDMGKGKTDFKKELRCCEDPFHQILMYKKDILSQWLYTLDCKIKPLFKKYLFEKRTI